MTDNRVVSIELPVSDGQIPVYNASQDKFVAGTGGSGTAAVINGPGVTIPPSATGTTSLVGGYNTADLGHTNAISLGVQASSRADTDIVMGYFPSGVSLFPAVGDILIGSQSGGSATFGGTGNSVCIGESAECFKGNSVAIGNTTGSTDINSITIGSGARTGSSAGAGSTGCIAIGSGAVVFTDVPNAIAIGKGADVRSPYVAAIGTNSQHNTVPGLLALGPSTLDSNIAGVSGPQGLSNIYMVTFVGQTTGSGAGEIITLLAADGTTGSIPFRPNFTQLCGLLNVEAQAKGVVSGNPVVKAFFSKYIAKSSGNVLITDPAASTIVVDAAASSWTLTPSLDGSSNLSFQFNTGTTTGVIKVVASIRFMLASV